MIKGAVRSGKTYTLLHGILGNDLALFVVRDTGTKEYFLKHYPELEGRIQGLAEYAKSPVNKAVVVFDHDIED